MARQRTSTKLTPAAWERIRRIWRILIWLPFRVAPETWHLRRRLRRINAPFDALLAKAKTHDEKQMLLSDRHFEAYEVEEALEEIETKRILRQCFHLRIPVPRKPYGEGEDEVWERSVDSGKWFLKDEGILNLRKLIRDEKKERRDYWLGWLLPLITAGTGIIGAITGLVAVWRG
jgi:hypothetical protein